jgi:phage shock protein A
MFGLFSKYDDPEKMWKQFLRDMQRRMPTLRAARVQAMENKQRAEKDYRAMQEELARIERQIPQAVKGGEATKQAALLLISRKKQLQIDLRHKKTQMDVAVEQAEETQLALNEYRRAMDKKFTEIRAIFPEHVQSKMLEDYAKLKWE